MSSQFKSSALGNLFLLIGPILGVIYLAIAAALVQNVNPHGAVFFSGLGVMVAGVCSLVRSKWDQIKIGNLLTWGISKDFPRMKKFHRAGYALIILGWLMLVFSGQV